MKDSAPVILRELGARILELLPKYMGAVFAGMCLVILVGAGISFTNSLLDLETAVLRVELEACQIGRNIDMVDQALDLYRAEHAPDQIKQELDDVRHRADRLMRQRTFDRQMRELDRIHQNIDSTATKLEELKDGS